MLQELFGIFNSVLTVLPNYEFFIGLMATGVFFGLGCLIKNFFVN